MPKKKFDPQEFVNDLLKDVELDDAKKAELSTLITGNEKLAGKLGESVMRQSDYSREIAKLQEQNESVQKFRDELVQWKQDNEQVVLNAKAEAEAYKRRLTDEGILAKPSSQPEVDYLTKKDLDKYLGEVQDQGINVMSKLTKLAVGHYNRYKEELDTDALVKQAIEAKLPLDVMYDKMKAPLDTKLQEKELERRIKEAKEEGRREALTQAGFPERAYTDDLHPLELAEAAAKDQMKVGWKAAAEAHMADYKAGKVPTA